MTAKRTADGTDNTAVAAGADRDRGVWGSAEIAVDVVLNSRIMGADS